MTGIFDVSGGSVTGRDHKERGQNNQDSFYWVSFGKSLVAVVSDGCGSGGHSEIGAKIGARIISRILAGDVCFLNEPASEEQFIKLLERVFDQTTAILRHAAIWMSGGAFDVSQTILDYFLFTVVGVLITPRNTVVFSLGDGLFAINGLVEKIGPFPENSPPYLGYSALGGRKLNFEIQRILPTMELDSALIATDGLGEFEALKDKKIPGKDEKVGELSQFWENDLFFRNLDAIRRKLFLMNREVCAVDKENASLIKENGLLIDDSTLVAVRRKKRKED